LSYNDFMLEESKNKNFYHEPHEHYELLIYILSLFVLVSVVRGKIQNYIEKGIT